MAGLTPQPVQGIVVYDSEVLEPDPVRQGGLMRSDAVRIVMRSLVRPSDLRAETYISSACETH